jgi:hypothetical protein
MRVLFVTCPEKTFFQPMVPLAWALRTAGHEVLVAAQPSFAGEITDAGLTAVPVGRQGTNSIRRLAGIDPETENRDRAGLPVPYRAAVERLDRETMTSGYRTVLTQWHKLNNFPLVAGLVEFAQSWRPDLVIWEATTYAGAIAAEACGAAHGRMMWSLDVFGVARRHYPMAEWLAGYGRRYGFEFSEDLVTGQFTIDALPPSLHLRADLDYLPMRYVPYGGRAVVPDWLRVRAERPRVALTLGTSATEVFAGYTVSVQDILTALSEMAQDRPGARQRPPGVVRPVARVGADLLGRDQPRRLRHVPHHGAARRATADDAVGLRRTRDRAARGGAGRRTRPRQRGRHPRPRAPAAVRTGLPRAGEAAARRDARHARARPGRR